MTFAAIVFLVLTQTQPAVDQSTNTGFVTATYRGVKDFILRGAEKVHGNGELGIRN